MREHRRSGKWLLLAMGVAALIAAIFWMYAVSGFSLAYGFCGGYLRLMPSSFDAKRRLSSFCCSGAVSELVSA